MKASCCLYINQSDFHSKQLVLNFKNNKNTKFTVTAVVARFTSLTGARL